MVAREGCAERASETDVAHCGREPCEAVVASASRRVAAHRRPRQRPPVLARRIISWLSQATLVLQDADVRFYRRYLRSLLRQVRYLRHTAGDARRGVARLQAVIALSYAALCIAGQARHIKSATERLKAE